MGKFYRPKRYDYTVADEGVWFDVVDELDNEYGSFKMRLIDGFGPRAKLSRERIKARYSAQTLKKMEQEDFVRVVVRDAVADWKIKGEDGKLVAFNEANLKEYFDDPESDYVIAKLTEFAGDITHYGETATVEDIEKN